jgi:hypothetical protein
MGLLDKYKERVRRPKGQPGSKTDILHTISLNMADKGEAKVQKFFEKYPWVEFILIGLFWMIVVFLFLVIIKVIK